jgi:RNA polymerase sigma factor (sigma-70 family)
MPNGSCPPQQGDEAILFERYGRRLVRLTAYTVRTSPDIADDACAFAWAQLLARQPRRETVFAWLRTVARHEALRLDGIARRATSLEREAASASADISTHTIEPESHRWTAETAQGMIEAQERLAALPVRERTIALLRAAGWRYDELAEHLGLSRTRVGQLLARADARLREMDIREHEPTHPRAARLRVLEDDPPSYLVASIGTPPRPDPKYGRAEQRREWRRLALAIDDYRKAAGVTDSVFPLGRNVTTSATRETLKRRIADYRHERGLSRGIER